jgi:DNA repair protein RadA/Sms
MAYCQLYLCCVVVSVLLRLDVGLLNGRYLSSLRPSTSLLVDTRLRAKSSNEVFYCTECGVEHVKWVGKCTSCNEWNCVKPMRVPKSSAKLQPLDPRTLANTAWLPQNDQTGTMISMSTIDSRDSALRLALSSEELGRVLGGGLVKGSTILLAGEPGIGKSTLLLQLANDLVAKKYGSVVYLSGEENPQQVAARALRLQLGTNGIYLLCETDTDVAGKYIPTEWSPLRRVL